MNAAPISKERSTITSEFLNTALPAGQTVFQALNYMPGVNFTNNDPYGSSGGDIRIHGQDGNHISLTLDGMPLNDTGNYASLHQPDDRCGSDRPRQRQPGLDRRRQPHRGGDRRRHRHRFGQSA